MRRVFLAVGVLAGFSVGAAAQTVDSYQLRYYVVGAPAPLQTEGFLSAAVTCNLVPPAPTASTVNPTSAYWTDRAVAGRVCRYDPPANGPLFSIPIGSYEATLVAINVAGSSPESGRAPFSRLNAPVAESGLRLVR